MSITVVASTAARNQGTGSVNVVVTLGAAVSAGDTLVLTINNRSDESTNVTGVSDTVNGAWPAAVVGPINSDGSTFRGWMYVFENSGAGTPVITVTFNVAINGEAAALGLHGSVATPEVDVIGTTYNSPGAAEGQASPITTANVAATAAGMLVGAMSITTSQASGPTMGSGETASPAPAGGISRTYVLTQSISGAGNESFSVQVASAARFIIPQVTFIEAGTTPSITSVGGDNSVTNEEQNVVTVGVNFDNTAPKATEVIRQGGFTYTLSIDSQDATTITADMPVIGATGPISAPHAGASTWAVINDDAAEGTKAVTITDEATTETYLIGTPNANAALRLTASPDAAAGDYVRISGVVGGVISDVNVNSDLTWDALDTVTNFYVQYWAASDGTWGDRALQTINAVTGGSTRNRDSRSRGMITPMWGRG